MTHCEGAATLVALAMSPTVQLLFWLAALAAAVVLLAFILLQIRRRMLSDAPTGGAGAELTLEDIRRLKQRGEISEREHRVLRAAAMARLGVEVDQAKAADDDDEAGSPEDDAATDPPDERRAAPGYDLTGEPLPGPSDEGPQQPRNGAGPNRGKADGGDSGSGTGG